MNNTRDPGVVQMGAGFRLPSTRATSLALRDAGSLLAIGKTRDPDTVKMGAGFRLPSTKAASLASGGTGPSLPTEKTCDPGAVKIGTLPVEKGRT